MVFPGAHPTCACPQRGTKYPFKKIVQTISYLPYFVSVSVVAGMTVMLLNPTSDWSFLLPHSEENRTSCQAGAFQAGYMSTEIWQGPDMDQLFTWQQ